MNKFHFHRTSVCNNLQEVEISSGLSMPFFARKQEFSADAYYEIFSAEIRKKLSFRVS